MTSGVSARDSSPGELLRLARRGKVLVLCYHGVSETWPDQFAVSPATLRCHLEYLRKHGYRGVTFSQALAQPHADRVVALTFDDGFRSTLTHALPILEEFEMPGTAFVPAAFPARQGPMQWPGIDVWLGTEHEHELTPLTWDELRLLGDRGWEIGSHSLTHPHLSSLGESELREELAGSRAECERQLDRPCTSIAFPYGDWNERVLTAVGEAGYSFAASTLFEQWGEVTQQNWPRIAITTGDSAWTLRKKTSPVLLRLRATPAWPAAAAAWRRLRHGGEAPARPVPSTDTKE